MSYILRCLHRSHWCNPVDVAAK